MTREAPAAPRDIAAYEQAYAGSGFETIQARYRKRLLLELLEKLKPERVLEVGCGLDTLANHWPHGRFVIVEPGAAFAGQARRQLAGRPGSEVVEGTLEAVSDRLEGGFDLILLSGLLHEVADCGPILGATRALCGPGTVVHANVPNARSLHRLLAFEMGLIQDLKQRSTLQESLQQPRTFDLEALQGLCEANGFEVIEAGSYFVKPFTHAQMQRLVAEGFVTEAMLDGFWGLARHMPGLGSEIFLNMRRAG